MAVKIRERPKGSGAWWVFIDHEGHRKAKKVGNKKTAQAVAKQIEAKITLGEYTLSAKPKKADKTFEEYAEAWFKTTVPATCKLNTIRDYQNIYRVHVKPAFNEFKIKDITRGVIKDFLLEKANEGYARSTINHMKAVISGVLNKAVDDEMIPANPAHRLGKLFKNGTQTNGIDPLTSEELTKLLDTVQEHFPRHYPLFLTLARTGMRIGEALALKWGDIDFNSRFIHVQRSLSRGAMETPKSGKTRKVDMSRQLTDTLLKLQEEREGRGIPKVVVSINKGESNQPEVSEWVFVNAVGNPIDYYNWLRRVFNPALEKGGIRQIRIHDLRHTYATLRIAKGDSIADVSKQLGHHSVKLTMDVYYHWIPGKKKSEVDELDGDYEAQPSATYPQPSPTETKKGLKNES